MPSMCERCQGEKEITLKSVMNEDAICSDCFKEEMKHPSYKDAKNMEILEDWKGNNDYPGLFSGQKYPFGERTAVSERFPLDKVKSPMMKRVASLQHNFEHQPYIDWVCTKRPLHWRASIQQTQKSHTRS